MYVAYCKNKPFSNSLLIEHGGNFFAVSEHKRIFYCGFFSHANVHIVVLITCNQLCLFWSDIIMYRFCTERAASNRVLQLVCLCLQDLQASYGHGLSISAYLIKPVQRITKYQLLLKVSDQKTCLRSRTNVNFSD